MMASLGKRAAFFRVEGTLVRRGALSLTTYLAANASRFDERLLRLSQVGLTLPAYGLLNGNDRASANRIAYLALRGMSEDRISVVGEEYFENVLKPRLLPEGLELMDTARGEGFALILVSDTVQQIAKPLARFLEVEHVLCNRLEFKQHYATGRLRMPVVGGREMKSLVTDFASRKGFSLARSRAYGAYAPDLHLLTSVGEPCAANPGISLLRAARATNWPVVRYRG